MNFKPIPVADPLVYHEKKRNYAVCGAGSGKTTQVVGGIVARDAILQPGYWDIDIQMGQAYEMIICEPTHEMTRDIAWDTVRQNIPEHLIVRSIDSKLLIVQGVRGLTKIYFRSGAQGENRIKAFKAVYRVYVDEFYQYKQAFFDELLTRLTKRDGVLFAIGTPEGTAWVEELLNAEAKNPDAQILTWTSYDNPNVSHSAIDDLKTRMSPELFERTFMARRGLFKGQIYKLNDNNLDRIVSVSRKDGVTIVTWDRRGEITYQTIVAGQDWGYAHNGALVVIGINGSRVDILDCIGEKSTPVICPDPNAKSWVNLCQEARKKWGFEYVYCGVDEPEHIDTYNENGITAYKAMNSVNVGIETVASMISSGHLTINSELESLVNGMRRYARDDNEKIIKKDDDEVDALRYAVYSAVYDRLINYDLDAKQIKTSQTGEGVDDDGR